MAGNRNPAISLCRVFSMFLIILCHIVHLYTFIPGSQFLKEVLNVGVYTFLAISGYLYGQKDIASPGRWLALRAQKIMLPASILSVCVFAAIAVAQRSFDGVSFLVYLVNLQGLAFFLPPQWIFFQEQSILAPLWFVTVIMLCYCLVPLLQKLRGRFPAFPLCLLLSVLITAGCYVLGFSTGITLFHFLTFSAGYCMGWYGEERCIKPLPFAGYTVCTMLLQGLRLWLRAVCDGTGYYQSFVGVSHMALGIWILGVFFLLGRAFPKLMLRLSQSRPITTLDGISLYVYMTHNVFVVSSLSPYKYTENLLISTVLFFLLSFASASPTTTSWWEFPCSARPPSQAISC